MRITQNLVNTFITIVKTHGYWSDNTREFLHSIPFHLVQPLHARATKTLGHAITAY